MGLVYSCGAELAQKDIEDVKNCARQLALRHKFLAAKRGELVIHLATRKKQGAQKAELYSALGRLKSLDAQIAKIVACHAMFESMKEATDTTNLLSTVKEHLHKTTPGDVGVPDPDTIYDIQDTLEIASDALRETNAALGSEWKLEAYTQRDQGLEEELQMYLPSGNQDHPSGPDSQSLEETSNGPSTQSAMEDGSKTPPWEEGRTSTETEARPFAAPSVPAIPPASLETPSSSTSPNTALKRQPKPLLSA